MKMPGKTSPAVLLLAVFTLAALALPLAAATIRIPQAAPSIQAGIDLAQAGDTVLVALGIYTGLGNKDLDFFGKDIALIGAGGSAATIIDCQGEGRGLSLISGETRSALVQGITIRNGNQPADHGGGIRCYASSPTLRDVIVQQCVAKYTGGVALNDEASPYLEDCIIEGNEARYDGGGLIICNGNDAVLVNVVIRNNYGGSYGGGVGICHSSPEFYNVTFEGNESPALGGGVDCYNSPAYFKDCVFMGNQAGSEGGAMYTGGPPILVEDCAFIGNSAGDLGGAISIELDWGAVFRDCLIAGNTAGAGGAVYVGEYSSYPPTQFINVTMVGNQCLWVAGSAVTANWQGKVDLIDCLITGNLGGTALWTDHGAIINVTCTNVWSNPAGNYGGDLADQTGIDGNLSVDPLFCDPGGDDYRLSGSSPCLPWNNDCGVQMGAFGAGCDLTAVGAPPPPGADLEANYPNPFNPGTTIPFSLSAPASVKLSIHDVAGRLVRSLAEGQTFPAGHHALHWNGLDATGQPAPSGVYFYRLETPAGATARPMLLIK